MSLHDIQVIGKAWIKDMDTLVSWYADSAPEWYAEIWKDCIYPMEGDIRKHISDYYEASKYSRGTFEESGRNRITENITIHKLSQKIRSYLTMSHPVIVPAIFLLRRNGRVMAQGQFSSIPGGVY